MRRTRFITAALLCWLATANAEPVRTNADVVLHKKPGEKQPVAGRLRAGTAVVIEAESGRWLRVRAGSIVGYLTRTSLVQPPANPRTAGTWAQKAQPLDQIAATGATTTPAADVAATETIAPERSRKVALHADVAIGYRSLGYDFTSNGSSGLANYLMSADAAATSLVIDASGHLGRVAIGGDLEGLASSSSPGVEYSRPNVPPTRIAFSTVAVDSGVRAGTQLGMFELALRSGIHYDAFLVHDVDNVGKLPRERLLGATLGLRAQVAPPRSRVAVAMRFDMLVAGTRRQTPGLEDGTDSTANALWAGATIRVELAHHFGVVFAYDFGRATTEWTGMSVREPGVNGASRVDSSQLVQLGVRADL